MATRDPKAGVSDQPDAEVWEGEGSDIESAIADLGTVDESATVLVSKWDKEHGQFGRLVNCPVQGFDSMRVMQEHGPGKYQFRVRVRGKQAVQRQLVYSGKHVREGDPAPASAPVATPPGFGVSELLAAMMQFQQNLILALVPALAGNKGGGGASITGADLIAAIKEGRESARQLPPPATPTDMLRDAVELGMDLANGGGHKENGENGSSGIMALLPRALTIFENLASRSASSPGASPSRPPAVAALGTGPAPPAEAVGVSPEARRFEALRKFGPSLLQEARDGQDPEVWGDFLAPRIKGELKDTLYQLVQLSEVERRAAMLAAEPQLEPYMDWVERASSVLREHWIQGNDDGEGGAASSVA
jgi:hypothetical protein